MTRTQPSTIQRRQAGRRRRQTAVSLCLTCVTAALLASVGCRGESVESVIERCADASGAEQSPNDELRRLLAQVAQERGLPKQLDRPLGPDADNAAAALSELYTQAMQDRLRSRVSQRLALVLNEGPDEDFGQFLKGMRTVITKTAEAVDKSRCRFDLRHLYGHFASLDCLDDATLATRLLLLRAIDSGLGGDAAPAEADVLRALRVAHCLARVQRVEARVLAGTLRAQSLDVVSMLFTSGVFQRGQAQTLYTKLRDQLADWPSDAQMLVGDRAATIHAYEAIRNGLLKRLLTGRERTDLDRRGALESLESASPEVIDADQAHYLRSMAALIHASQRPFFQRIGEIERVARPTENRLFAERVFLLDLVDTQRAVARDLARCEAWAIALASAADLQPPPLLVCPTNGRDYEVVREAQRVWVVTGDEVVGEPSLPDLVSTAR